MRKWKHLRRDLGLEGIIFHLQYWAVRFASILTEVLDPRTVLRLGEWAGRIYYHLDPRHREIGRENLRASMPALSEERTDEILRGVYRHFGCVVAELMVSRRHSFPRSWRRHAVLEHLERIDEALARGKGLVLAGGHLGNWELGGYLITNLGYPVISVARSQDNPLLNDYLNLFRTSKGQQILDKKGSLRKVAELLRRGSLVALLIDQDAKQRGLFVEFFGRPASTYPTPARMALQYGTPVLPFYTWRAPGRFFYHIGLGDPIFPRGGASPEAELYRITREINRQLEDFIRAHPDQYLWVHRRWKSRPEDVIQDVDGDTI